MASLNYPLDITGSLGGLSFYRRKDCDKIIVRSRGGASRKKIREDPGMEGTRRVNAEFGGRSTACRYILAGFGPLRGLADYNLAPALNKLLRPIQLMDKETVPGQRAVCISKAPWLLEGFPFSRRRLMDAIIATPIAFTVNPGNAYVTVTLPALLPGINFIPPVNTTYFRFIVCNAILPDLVYSTAGYKPAREQQYPSLQCQFSDWNTVNESREQLAMEIPISLVAGEGERLLMTALGIQFGKQEANSIAAIDYMGTGKILAVRVI
jgi:hypothetical protein